MKVFDLLDRQKYNNKVAIKCEEEVVTYCQWYKASFELSEKIKIAVGGESKNIGVFLPNSVDYCISYFSILFAEKVVVPISNNSTYEEILQTVEFCEIDLLITNSENLHRLKGALEKYKYKVLIYNYTSSEFISVLGDGEYVPKSKINVDGVALLLHTSGSTGTPKRVMLTDNNLISNVKANIESLNLSSEDKVLISLPIFFGYSNTSQFLTHVYLGATIVIFKGLMLPRILFSIIKNEAITNYTIVPSVINMILEDKNSQMEKLPSLRYICFGGGKISLSKLEQFIQLFPKIGVVHTYGQTEASPRITALLPEYKISKIGSVGKPIPNVEVEILIENQGLSNNKQVGEIIVKSPGVMKGYYKDTPATERTIIDGWLHTGDLGYFDEDGFLFVNGRKKNIIISGGVNISAEEIESVLLDHDNVKEVYVYSIPDEFLVEVPCADIVVCDENCDNQFSEFCSKRLNTLKIPRKFNIVKTLPKTYNGKIRRDK